MVKNKITVLEKVRTERGMTKADLARVAEIQQGVIGWIESRRFVPYDAQLEKIATALEWKGDLQILLKEVDDND